MSDRTQKARHRACPLTPASKVVGALVVVFVGMVGCAVPALAAPLAPTSAPLAGSTFQGGDGNQVSEGPFNDWDALQSTGRVGHNDDPNGQDTSFQGGTEEGNPAAWRFTTEAGGGSPAKSNILDAWAAGDQPGGGGQFFSSRSRALRRPGTRSSHSSSTRMASSGPIRRGRRSRVGATATSWCRTRSPIPPLCSCDSGEPRRRTRPRAVRKRVRSCRSRG